MISINPATEKTIGELKEFTEEQIFEIVKKARQSSWKNLDIKEKTRIIQEIIPLIQKNKDKIATLITKETGKPIKQSRHEIDMTISRIQFYVNNVPEYLKPEILYDYEKETNIIRFDPLGIIVVISPWNAPFFLSLVNIIPALLAGNSVIVKPSEYTSFIGLEINNLFEILKEKRFPENTFFTVIGSKDIGRKLVSSDIDMVSFTGSIIGGKSVMKNSADRLHKIILELGGKDPAIVLEDVDIRSTVADIVKAAIMNTGQVCCSIERVYVLERIYDNFVKEVVSNIKQVNIGDPLNENTDMGPFTMELQLNKVIDHVKDAVNKGAKILIGGKRIKRKGYFFEPTVITNVDHSMKIMKEETFGPIIPIMKVYSIEEAVKLANDSLYGLTASVWTRDLEMGKEIAKQINAGTVSINRHGTSKAGCPWGGCKQSGIGRIYSKEGIREFTNIKHVWVIK